jgi:acetate kinase
MGTRSGDLDPGLLVYNLTPEQMDKLVNHDCGLARVSESTGEMSELIAHLSMDEKARQAFGTILLTAKKRIGA